MQKDPRQMTDEELRQWKEAKKERGEALDPGEDHRHMFLAFGNPIRKDILKSLKGEKSIEDIADGIGISKNDVNYHLQFLEQVSLVSRRSDEVDLTPRGVAFIRNVKSL